MTTVIFKKDIDSYDLLDPYYGGLWNFSKNEITEFLNLTILFQKVKKSYEMVNKSIIESNNEMLKNIYKFVCSEDIPLNTNYFSEAVIHRLDEAEKGIITPPEVVFEVSRKCNYRCPWCYIPKMENIKFIELTYDEIFNKIVIPLIKNGTKRWTLTGGEPSITFEKTLNIANFISERTKEIWNTVPIIDILTNGYKFSEYAQDYWDANIRIVQFQLSSPNEKEEIILRDPINGVNSFQYVITGVKKAKSIGFQTSINMVVEPRNIMSVEKMIELAYSLNLDCLRLTPVVQAGKAKKNNISLSKNDYIFIQNIIDKCVNKLGVNSKMNILYPSLELEKKRPIWCGLGFLDLYIAYDGKVYPCNNLLEDELICDPGTIRDCDVLSIWYKSKMLKQFRNYEIPNIGTECGMCSDRSMCVGNCIARCWHQFGKFNLIEKPQNCFANIMEV